MKKERLRLRVTEDTFRALEDEYMGICVLCGMTRDECEPDARGYPCESCGKNSVYGASELLIAGRLEICEKPEEETIRF